MFRRKNSESLRGSYTSTSGYTHGNEGCIDFSDSFIFEGRNLFCTNNVLLIETDLRCLV